MEQEWLVQELLLHSSVVYIGDGERKSIHISFIM